MNLLIIGTGVYVCGRGTDGYGTILPAVMQCHKTGIIDTVLVANKSNDSLLIFKDKVNDLEKNLAIDFAYQAYPDSPIPDPDAYKQAIQDLPDPGAVIIVTPYPFA